MKSTRRKPAIVSGMRRAMYLLEHDSLLSTPIPVSSTWVVTYSLTALALISFKTLCYPYSIATISKYETFSFINLAALGLTTFYTTTSGSQTVATHVSIAVAFTQFLGLLNFKILRQNTVVESICTMVFQFQEEKCWWQIGIPWLQPWGKWAGGSVWDGQWWWRGRFQDLRGITYIIMASDADLVQPQKHSAFAYMQNVHEVRCMCVHVHSMY